MPGATRDQFSPRLYVCICTYVRWNMSRLAHAPQMVCCTDMHAHCQYRRAITARAKQDRAALLCLMNYESVAESEYLTIIIAIYILKH